MRKLMSLLLAIVLAAMSLGALAEESHYPVTISN